MEETREALLKYKDAPISCEVLTALLNELDPDKWPADRAGALFKEISKTGDSTISGEEFAKWVFKSASVESSIAAALEAGVEVGSSVIARLSGAGDAKYIYGRVQSKAPLSVRGAFGESLAAEQLTWAALAKDDGWLEPYHLQWQQPGRMVIFKLLESKEWVSGRIAATHTEAPIKQGILTLQLEGVPNLSEVKIQDEIDLLFVAHEECQAEFGGGDPKRGGRFLDHIMQCFKTEEDGKAQRERWVLKGRVDGQYPLRCVWVHPQIKQKALSEFVRRCQEKRKGCDKVPAPEIVMLLGPPAAGKSSISRLPPNQVPEALRDTCESLKYREEVNNDNLTDCMPGFEQEYKECLEMPAAPKLARTAWKKMRLGVSMNFQGAEDVLDNAEDLHVSNSGYVAWAMQWLVYLLYHHGPVRDSLAWDVIKTTVIDAAELPVYYSSVMAGKSIGRTMQILELAHSQTSPVPHTPLRFVGFWPYASQEARYSRQKHRANAEKTEKKLKGGNLDSNLVDIHYHAQQAEMNITNMLASLRRGEKPTDEPGAVVKAEATEIKSDHFLIIDNDGAEPRLLLDFANEDDDAKQEGYLEKETRASATAIMTIVNTIPEWFSLCQNLFRIASFFLAADDPLISVAGSRANDLAAPTEPEDLLPILTEVDEEVFMRINKDSTATETDQYRGGAQVDLTPRGMARLMSLTDADAATLKTHIGLLRKLCVVVVMKDLRDEESDTDSDDEKEK